MSDKLKTNSKHVSFEDIQKKFINFSEPQSISDNTSDIKFFSNPEQLDASHFKFDTNSPNAILIAGCGASDGSDAGAGGACDAGGGAGAGAGCDAGCADSSSCKSGAASGCDASCSL